MSFGSKGQFKHLRKAEVSHTVHILLVFGQKKCVPRIQGTIFGPENQFVNPETQLDLLPNLLIVSKNYQNLNILEK